MNAKEIKALNATELSRLAMEKRQACRDLRFKAATRQLAKVHQLNEAKRDLARVEAEIASRTRA